MDIILILRIIIIIMFCLAGFQIGNWLSPSKEVKNIKKIPSVNEVSEELINYSMKLLKESKKCDERICPVPKDWKGDKK